MNLNTMPDEELIKLATADASAYKETFLQDVRMELYGRGYIFKEKRWQQHDDIDHLKEIFGRLNGLEARLVSLEGKIPDTQLLSASFTNRAFAVLGHAFVANIMIAIPIWILTWIFG